MSKELTATIEVEEVENEIIVSEDEVQVVFTSDHARATNRDLPNQHPIKAIDGLEALIQHNISDLSTWIEKEYDC